MSQPTGALQDRAQPLGAGGSGGTRQGRKLSGLSLGSLCHRPGAGIDVERARAFIRVSSG